MFFKEFPIPKDPKIPERSISILDFGKCEDGNITEATRRAIEYINGCGGGRVVIPEGEWTVGGIVLCSNLELHISDGARVTFIPDPELYLPVELCTYGGIRCYNYRALIYGRGLSNVALTGSGTLYGCGEVWWSWAKNMTAREILYHGNLPLEKRVFGTPEYGLRPMFMQVLESKNVLIDGPVFKNSPCWTVSLVYCEDVIVRNVTVENPTVSPNTDGINIECTNRALVEDCTVVTAGDDMFCVKAGRNEDAWEVGIPSENVIIRRCRGLGESRSGGIVIGSEMSAGVRNVLAEDCDFADNLNCVRIKSKDGRGGVVENIDFRRLHMGHGMRGINLSYRYSCEATDDAREPGKYMPVFRNISFENIVCDDVEYGIAIDGIPGGVMQNLRFKDVSMTAEKCLSCDSADGLYMENVRLTEKPHRA